MNSTYIMEGILRASNRSLREASFEDPGLPYRRYNETEQASILVGEPTDLVFGLLPTPYLFQAGNRIRTTVASTDTDSFAGQILDPTPEVRLLGGASHASHVELPFIP